MIQPSSKKLLPFLQQDLLANGIIEYSIDPGVDLTERYFVLWEPFIRAKIALLIGEITDRAKEIVNVNEFIPLFIHMISSEEDIEQAFALFAVSEIGIKQSSSIAPFLTQLFRPVCNLLRKSVNPTRAFSLFRSIPFQLQLFESFLEFCQIDGIFEIPDNVQRLLSAGFSSALVSIALCPGVYIPKKPEFQWLFMKIFLRLVTEHPTGNTFFDLDIFPKQGIDLCTLMRICLLDKNKAGEMRNDIASTVKQTAEEWTAFFNRWKSR